MKIIYCADLHIGANKFGVDAATWNAPLWDIVETVKNDNNVEYVVISGDAFHKRHPTTDELDFYRHWVSTLNGYGAVVIDIAGNHDYGVRAESLPGSDFFDEVMTYKGKLQTLVLSEGKLADGLQLIAVPWPRLVDYSHTDGNCQFPIDEELRIAAVAVEQKIEKAVADFDGQSIIAGHMHVWYGGSSNRTDVDGPGLMMGRDLLVSWTKLAGLPNMIGMHLGHIHTPGRGYVGSSQPTDFADETVKRYELVEYELAGTGAVTGSGRPMWHENVESIEYRSSLKVKDFKLESHYDWSFPDEPEYDIVRGTYTATAAFDDGATNGTLGLREWLSKWGKTVLGATVIPYRGESRVSQFEKPDGWDLSDPREAIELWARERGMHGDTHALIDDKVRELLTAQN